MFNKKNYEGIANYELWIMSYHCFIRSLELVYYAEHEQSFVEVVGAFGDFLLLVGAARDLHRFADMCASVHRLLVEHIIYAGVASPFADGLA